MADRPRNVTVDIAKGLGILLVVLGHNAAVIQNPGILQSLIYSFHVPLFFFLAGLFIRPSETARRLWTSRTESLLKPYLAALLIAYCLKATARPGPLLERYSDFPAFIGGTLYATGSSIIWTPLWFLPHLFLASLIAWALLRSIREPRLIWALCILLLAAGYFFLTPAPLPWSVDLLGISLPFLLAGYVLREKVLTFKFNAWITIAAVICFLFCWAFYPQEMDLNNRRYGKLIPATLEAACGIYLCLATAALIGRTKVSAQTFSYIGSATLFILLFHGYIQGRALGSLSKRIDNEFIAASIAFLISVAIPIAFWELARRNRVLTAAFLPRSRQAQSSHLENQAKSSTD